MRRKSNGSPSRTRGPLTVYSFTSHLQDGETLLWQGKPLAAAYVWPKALRDAALIIPVLFAAMWLESLRPGFTLAVGSVGFWVCCVLAYGGSCWHLVRETRQQAEHTEYALTSRRVFIRHIVTLQTQEKRMKVEELALASLRPRLTQGRRPWGSITFGLSPLSYGLAFRAIPDAADVYVLLEQARACLPNALPDAPYYARRSSRPAFSLDAHLRAGEAQLWQGKSNRVSYIHQEMRVALSSGVGLVALFGGLQLAMHGLFTLLHFLGVIVAGGLVLYPLLFWGLGKEACSVDYYVTNQRAIIVRHGSKGAAKWDYRSLAQMPKMRLVRQTGGTGTVIFEKHSRFIWHGQSGTVATEEFTFKSIDDAANVFAVVTEARLQLQSANRSVGDGRSSATV